MSEVKDNIMTYKGKPLVRQDKMICYGSHSDKYILILNILETKKEKGFEIASRVFVRIQRTGTAEKKDDVVKFTEKNSLYEAFDIGEAWLDKYLAE